MCCCRGEILAEDNQDHVSGLEQNKRALVNLEVHGVADNLLQGQGMTPAHYRKRSDEPTIDALVYMHKGVHVMKLCKKRSKAHVRYLFLSNDNTKLMWRKRQHRTKNDTNKFLYIRDITNVVPGQTNKSFNVKNVVINDKPRKTTTLKDQSFSIIYNNQSLDLISTDCSVWINGIRYLQKQQHNGADLRTIRNIPFWCDKGSVSSIQAIEGQASEHKIEITRKRVQSMLTKLRQLEEQYHLKQSTFFELRSMWNKCQTKLNSVREHLTEDKNISIGDLKNWKVEIWKIDVDLGALELQLSKISKENAS